MEPVSKSGHWYWKEDTKTLEFASSHAMGDGRERARKGRAIHFQDLGNRVSDRAATQYLRTMAGAKSPDRSFTERISRSPRHTSKLDHGCVALSDAKRVALSLLQEQERLYINSFSSAVRTRPLDDFLMALLHYLSCFLEKNSFERKPKSLVPKPSILEHGEMAAILTRTDLALKHLAHMYCILVLGEGRTDQHHMACGKSKASATRSDRMFYECLYSFCIYVAWVVFRRKQLRLIQEEVGRILRSDTFNPALRVKHTPENPGRNLSADRTKPRKSATCTDNRKENLKRPAIKSIITQRSPVLVSLMPSPKERSPYLFHQHRLHPSGTQELADLSDWLSSFLITPQIGILGEPLEHFNPHSLVPLETGEEEEEPEIWDKKSTATHYSHMMSPRHSNLRPMTGRQSTVISRATTEAAYSDTD
ncbi:protein phosphatase 1 regulatory subunit 36 [Pelodytes ibericus]